MALTASRKRTIALGVAALMATTAAIHVGTAGRASTRPPDIPNFHLADTGGQTYSLESFASELVLVIYFGYTTCLQACPTALDSIAGAIDGLGEPAKPVRLVFVDMDPAVAALVSLPLYMEFFGPSFLGLTGSPENLAQAARAFDVEVERLQFSDDPTDYTMTHTSPIFVMRPDDLHPVSLPATSSPDEIGAVLRDMLEPARTMDAAVPRV